MRISHIDYETSKNKNMRIGIDEFKFTSEIKSKINIQEAIISLEKSRIFTLKI